MLEINFLWNRIDFLKEHKLSPILLIWLHLGVWENVFPVQTPGFVGVKEKIFLIILFVYLPNCCQMWVTTVVVTGYCIFWFVNLTEQLHLWQILLPNVADVIATLIVFFIGCYYCQWLWLMLLPKFNGWCCCQMWLMLFATYWLLLCWLMLLPKADVFTFCGRWNSHFLCDGLMLLPCGRGCSHLVRV